MIDKPTRPPREQKQTPPDPVNSKKLERMQQAARDLEQAWPAKLGQRTPAHPKSTGGTSQ